MYQRAVETEQRVREELHSQEQSYEQAKSDYGDLLIGEKRLESEIVIF